MSIKQQAATAARMHVLLDHAVAQLQRVVQHGKFDRKAEAAATDVAECYKTARYACAACGAKQQNYRDYMVHDALWETLVGHTNVCVCLPCLESELGRDIAVTDLKRGPRGEVLPANERLMGMFNTATKSLVVTSENEKAKMQKENESYYASLMNKAMSTMSPEQLEALKEVEEGEGNAYGVTADPIKGVKKRAVQESKRRGYQHVRRKKK